MIFYLEDDVQIRDLTIYTLEQTGHDAEGFSNSDELYAALESETPDMILLDIMLPGEDGLSVLQNLRSRDDTKNIPIMMITAKSTEFDTVTGLDSGADDYLSKPFGMMEMVARVNALLRRAGYDLEQRESSHDEAASSDDTDILPDSDVLKSAWIELDPARRKVYAAKRPVLLTRKEFEMLEFLMRNHGIVVTRDQILNHVWGYGIAGQTRTVDAHVQTLRKKLSEASPEAAETIETVRGVGYRLRDDG